MECATFIVIYILPCRLQRWRTVTSASILRIEKRRTCTCGFPMSLVVPPPNFLYSMVRLQYMEHMNVAWRNKTHLQCASPRTQLHITQISWLHTLILYLIFLFCLNEGLYDHYIRVKALYRMKIDLLERKNKYTAITMVPNKVTKADLCCYHLPFNMSMH